MPCFCIAVILEEMLSERPSIRSLHDVIQQVAPHSEDIGVQLGLPQHHLNAVKTDHPTNCVLRCKKIFERFLQQSENPTWGEVLSSIRKVNLITVANDIEKDLPG